MNKETAMPTEKNKGQKNWFIGVFMPVIVTFSLLLVFSDRISSKPTKAGFWIILAFGVSLGAAITVTMLRVKHKYK